MVDHSPAIPATLHECDAIIISRAEEARQGFPTTIPKQSGAGHAVIARQARAGAIDQAQRI
jgi:hypothetical protein